MKHYEANKGKLMELLPEVQWAALRWLDVCRGLNLNFRISEVYRTQERQNELYKQGRTKPGSVVTWTLKSYHTMRLAVDVYPENCTHEQITDIARLYGITHPFPAKDPPHYEMRFVTPYQPPTFNVEAKIKALTRGIARATGSMKILLAKQLERLRGRL